FMVSSSLLCIGAQRLGRKICDNCKLDVDIPNEGLIEMGFLESELGKQQLFGANPNGCPRCNAGYKGRFPILETLYLEENLRKMIVEGASVHDLKREAVSQGMISLRRVALLNAMRGCTSIEEVLRVTMADE
ncbi:MAG: type IV pilus assembly protein PilB, partial [Candidatus Paceibacteria bacterium]